MSIQETDWIEEQQRVHLVTGQIGERIERLEAEVGAVKTDVVDIRRHFWDDVTVNLGTHDDLAETYRSMKQQAEVLSERERSYRNTASALSKFRRLKQSPYFGRIDFRENGQQKVEHIYLGIASFLDEEQNDYLVYDWRAPISSLYYDYSPGDAAFETPSGEVSGEMLLKRQFAIRDGDIRFMFDTGVTIGDELLQQVLSRSSDSQMRSIVATIQKEQNQIIRNDRSRMLIVQGAAGSGKTSAALQRVAYLLYKYRETLQADQMVLFSPNPMFNSYVATVLPELGEENMQQTTFQEYLERRLGRRFEVEDPFNQMEYVLTAADEPGYQVRLSGIRYKSSADYLLAIRTYKDLLEREGMLFTPVRFRGGSIVTSEQMRDKFYSFDASVRLRNRLVLMKDWLLEEIRAYEKSQRREAWVEEEIELLDAEDYLRAHNKLRRIQKDKDETFDDFHLERDILARMVLQEKLKPLRTRVKNLRFVDVYSLYRQLFTDERIFNGVAEDAPQRWHEICRQTLERLDRGELAYEDATPYLYLQELLLGFQTNTSVRHVIVDEAQDYSPFQLEFLKRLFPRSRMTALGDLNQSIYAHASALSDYDPIAALYGPDHTEFIRLTRSYRSTREIVKFSQGMVPGGEEIVPFNRSGEQPMVIAVADHKALHDKIVADITALRTEGYDSIAVICQTAAESAEAYEALSQRVRLGLVTKHTPSFEKGTLVLPAYLAKGVEFDAVIIYNGSNERYSREQERKLFYTACTRAMHLLHIYSVGEPSVFITTQPADTYKVESLMV
ncbi:RNA polymerase recycling motor HelD [Paenibacillus xerothermodurans]|uniref:Helicase n=1 Tax=Paenibacillus xerothermodurans TaxID=1977292 RepID=A0A2W1P4H4_PAEXE|nr:RNA polymerase recycling motor HelD [Paenibacillus xerothermodurans]PZE22622.1 helicase [Paenibacillus xerothermodurans]